MTPLNRSILVVSTFLLLCSGAALANEEQATDSDLAQLAVLKDQLQTRFETRLRDRVDGVIATTVHPALATRTTELLTRSQSGVAELQQAAPPAAPSWFDDIRVTNEAQPRSNTACLMTGRTLQCVLHDPASERR